MRCRLAYGRTGLEIDLPDDAPLTIIEPCFTPGLPDEQSAILAALHSPLGAPPLRDLVAPAEYRFRGGGDTASPWARTPSFGTGAEAVTFDDDILPRVAVVFSDLTRPMPNERVLPLLLAELDLAGVPQEQIVLINGLGTHRPQTNEELRRMLGDEVVDGYRIVQHNAWDDDNLVAVARNHAGRPVRVNRAYMDASVRILTGFIEPHFFAGFSGGPKAVLPAIADVESILDNHGPRMIADPRVTWLETERNPLWQEMLAVAQATHPDFLLNVTLNQERQITGVFAGNLVDAHRAGVNQARQAVMRLVPEPFDIVITSNSGYPLDLNLYQAVKGMSTASQIVRHGGDIIVAAECWDGIPDHGEYKRLLWEADSVADLLERLMAPGFRCHDQWEAQVQAQIQRKANVHVYATGLTAEELEHALVIPCRSIEETVARLRQKNPEATLAVLPDGPQTVPFVAESCGVCGAG